MPIYAYRCSACGHAKDVLQKMADAPLTQCPACQGETFAKQVTAAGFQLKGSGWYVTDFRGGQVAPSASADSKAPSTPSSDGAASNASTKPADTAAKPADSAASAPASASTN
ncbi:MAG: FmdB family zinc ribbon protein [Burkholderiaceae bacterium]